MLHLVYQLHPTRHARSNLKEFWTWVSDREKWFYRDLEMVSNPRWYICTVGSNVHSIEHTISFEDEAAWGLYRREVSRRSKDSAWEKRRIEQDLWWEISEARLLNDAPIMRENEGQANG
ncbi:hypothetical protein [Stappia stellulata]|uniref:hypothetical protein n=1 Tax=Stappia stellulata TaxID=71235 RepID=UPI000A058EDB|nr:hypothetical protein [Stappia stellulata]